MPWNDVIHASTKSKTKDGSWKYKRGVDKGIVATVEAELKGVIVVNNGAPIVTSVPTAQAPAPVELAKTITELMNLIITNGSLPEATINEICTRHGVNPPNLTGVTQSPEKIPAIYAEVEALFAGSAPDGSAI